MTRTTISDSQVFGACFALQQAGEPVTNRRVREMLDNTGSMGTIARYVKEWKARNQYEPGKAPLTASIQAAVELVYTRMQEGVDETIAEIEGKLEDQIRTLQQELDTAHDANRGLTEALEEQRGIAATRENETLELQTLVNRLESEKASLRDEISAERSSAAQQVSLLKQNMAALEGSLLEQKSLTKDLQIQNTALTRENVSLAQSSEAAKAELEQKVLDLTLKLQDSNDRLAELANNQNKRRSFAGMRSPKPKN